MNDATVRTAVEAEGRSALAAMRFVHEHPELGHEERECAAYLASVLERGGFEVERGLAGMETAFRAAFQSARPGRAVGLACLYDAVAAVRPDGSIEAVHSCGHGPIAGGVVGAALAPRVTSPRAARNAGRARLPRGRDPRAPHAGARGRQAPLGRRWSLGLARCGALRAP